MKQQIHTNEAKSKENYFIDRFEVDQPAGKVIGHHGSNGIVRQGVDLEGVIGIDNGTLRIEPALHDGWARSGIAYGPYHRENGLTLAVSLINGHNTSQAGFITTSMKQRIYDWVQGSNSWPLYRRLGQWIRYHRKGRTLRMWRRWWEMYQKFKKRTFVPLDENLAVGWFKSKTPSDPRTEGNAFIVHATDSENGELWVRSGSGMPPLIRGLQNIPLYYLVVLREQGAAYYAAAVPDTPHLPAYPMMRPLAIDPFIQDLTVYAGLFQSVFGQIGFRADTLVRDIQVAKVESLSDWSGTAHAADRLQGEGTLEDSAPEKGLRWVVPVGGFQRTNRGLRPVEQDNLAIMETSSAAGLIHVLVQTEEEFSGALRLVWRYRDPDNYWAWEIGTRGSQLMSTTQGETTVLAQEDHLALEPHRPHSLQVLDYAATVQLILDGKRIRACKSCDPLLQDEPKVGIACRGTSPGLYFSALEVHSRTLPIPEGIDLRPPWTPSAQRVVVAEDHFEGQPGDLAGRLTPTGQCLWQREIGNGIIEITGNNSAAVRGSVQNPNPGRTVYTIPWNHPGYADLELEFVPPGASAGQGEKSRAGLIFYQDPDNYITVSTYVDDATDFASFAYFYHLNGFEEIYDAIWSNVGQTITWGKPTTARVVMEGVNMAVYIDGEAVLYRSLTDVYPDIHHFNIRKVGMVVNWEWGNDTGTIFKKFVAAGRDHPSLSANGSAA